MQAAQVVHAIGDLHGDLGCARHWVRRTGAVTHFNDGPDAWEWADPSHHMIFMGDYIDKGPQALGVLRLVKSLTERFPEHVTALLGNHELNLLVDRLELPGRRYMEFPYAATHPAEYAQWLPAEQRSANTSIALDALYEALLRVYGAGLYRSTLMTPLGPKSIVRHVRTDAQDVVREELTRWQAAYLSGVAPTTEIGQWLQRRPLTHVIEPGLLFAHGGVPANLLGDGGARLDRAALSALNAAFAKQSADMHAMLSAAPHAQVRTRLASRCSSARKPTCSARMCTSTSTFTRVRVHTHKHSHSHAHPWVPAPAHAHRGPTPSAPARAPQELVEYRGLHRDCAEVRRVKRALNVSRIVLGHTPDNSVRVLCDGGLLAIDSALGRWFRASGNNYCAGDADASSPDGAFACHAKPEACEGQTVRLERDGDAWSATIVGAQEDEARTRSDEL